MTNPASEELKKLQNAIAYEDTFSCVQCGYCLPVCPTYETMGKETYSPRGRIHLVKMVAEGKLKDFELLSDSIDTCLGCRACETACPTGVKYGNIYESAKNVIEQQRPRSKVSRIFRGLLFKHVFPNKNLLNMFSALLWIYQVSALEKVVNRLRLHRLLPGGIGAFAAILPRQTNPWKRLKRPKLYKPANTPENMPSVKPENILANIPSVNPSVKPADEASIRLSENSLRHEPRKSVIRAAFFSGCIMDAMFEKTNRLGMELLQAAGCEVVSLTGETCCGALHAHAGELELAKQMAKRNIIALELMEKQGHIDYVVHTAGGCGAMLIEYDHLLREEEEWVERARHFTSKSKDISEVLIQANPLPFRQMNDMNKIGKNNHSSNDKGSSIDAVSIIGDSQPQQMVTYQRSCHMTHVQKSVVSPLQLLQSVPGTQPQEMPDKDKCCGSAGIYNIVNYEESMQILDVKMKHVEKTQAATIITTNPGCLLQMQLGIQRSGRHNEMRAIHLVEYLAEACGIE